MDATVLAQVLRALPPITDPNVLVSTSTSDDAGVYRLNDVIALVQTVDFFTPIVDDPRTFGAIAAANALSDVYAMGARPVTAIAIAGFPENGVPQSVLADIFAGGAEKAREAGIDVIGGHTVKDAEPKYGLAVTGVAHPEKIWRNSTALPGDVLVLTKPIGTGILTTARRSDAIDDRILEPAIRSMLLLNRDAAMAAAAVETHAVTDVSGFGLLGHTAEMAVASGCGAVIEASAVPLFDGVLDLARANAPGGSKANLRAALENGWTFASSVQADLRLALCDAQTSGGLLIAVAERDVKPLLLGLHAAGIDEARKIGTITADRTLRVR